MAFRADLAPPGRRSGRGTLHWATASRDPGYAPHMAFDEGLGDRIRILLGDDPDVSERRMFGGLAFMVAGNMACGVIGDDVLVRVGRDAYDAMVRVPFAGPMEMGDRTMGGFVVVDGEGVAEDDQLEEWVERGAGYAASLPPK